MRERVIWKYEIPIADEFTLKLPHEAKIIHIDIQRGRPQMWVLVDPTEELTEYQFIVLRTGQPIPTDKYPSYKGTFQSPIGDEVFHVFEVYEIPF